MLMAVHAGAGAVIGELSQTAFSAFTLSFLLHFLMDFIPHGDHAIVENHFQKKNRIPTYTFILSDLIVSLVFILALSFSQVSFNKTLVLWGVFGGILPDFLVAIYQVTKVRFLKGFNDFHYFVHDFLNVKKDKRISLASGLAMQMTLFYLLFAALI